MVTPCRDSPLSALCSYALISLPTMVVLPCSMKIVDYLSVILLFLYLQFKLAFSLSLLQISIIGQMAMC